MEAYDKAAVLKKYGFEDNSWTGPEPHGAAPPKTGAVRDPLFADEAIGILERVEGEYEAWERAKENGEEQVGPEPEPFLLVICLVNPHDVCLNPTIYRVLGGFPMDDECVPHVPMPPSHS